MNTESSWHSFNDFVADLAVRSELNDGATIPAPNGMRGDQRSRCIVRGSAIGQYHGSPGEGNTTAPGQHFLTMCTRTPACFERAGIHNNWMSFVKPPGMLCFVPAGVPSGARARSDFEMVACALDLTLVNAIDQEQDHRPAGDLRLRANFNDPAAQQLLKLLLADFASECSAGRLYTDHLIYALACRVLFIGRDVVASDATRPASGLPSRILKRVVDKMRVSDAELSLESLAQESGYSRVHFVRMFKAATGRSPHNYLLNMRVERVRELLANPALSLIDIALECGFSSHSHMTRAFRQFLGVTPSEYRRAL